MIKCFIPKSLVFLSLVLLAACKESPLGDTASTIPSDFHPGVSAPDSPITAADPPREGLKVTAGSALNAGTAVSANISIPNTKVKVTGTQISGYLSITN